MFVNDPIYCEKARVAHVMNAVEGVIVTAGMESAANGRIKFAFIEGPDKIRIELVEGQAHKE